MWLCLRLPSTRIKVGEVGDLRGRDDVCRLAGYARAAQPHQICRATGQDAQGSIGQRLLDNAVPDCDHDLSVLRQVLAQPHVAQVPWQIASVGGRGDDDGLGRLCVHGAKGIERAGVVEVFFVHRLGKREHGHQFALLL